MALRLSKASFKLFKKQHGFSMLEILLVLGAMVAISGLIFLGFSAQQRDIKIHEQTQELRRLYDLTNNISMNASDFSLITFPVLRQNEGYPKRLITSGVSTVWGGALQMTQTTVPTVLNPLNPAIQWSLLGVRTSDCIQLVASLNSVTYQQIKIENVIVNVKNMGEIQSQCATLPYVTIDLIQAKAISAPKDELGMVSPLCSLAQWKSNSFDTNCGYCKLGTNMFETTNKRVCNTQWGAGTDSVISGPSLVSSTCAVPADITSTSTGTTVCPVSPTVGNILNTYQTITKCSGTPDIYSLPPTLVSSVLPPDVITTYTQPGVCPAPKVGATIDTYKLTTRCNAPSTSVFVSSNTSQCRSPCTTPWGAQVLDGASVVAYSAAATANCATASQTRTCSNGVLSGSFANASCTNLVQGGCTTYIGPTGLCFGGGKIVNGVPYVYAGCGGISGPWVQATTTTLTNGPYMFTVTTKIVGGNVNVSGTYVTPKSCSAVMQ